MMQNSRPDDKYFAALTRSLAEWFGSALLAGYRFISANRLIQLYHIIERPAPLDLSTRIRAASMVLTLAISEPLASPISCYAGA